ncbi:MAG: RimK family alpha-L-glutamate ligase [Candidatus Woesearchaeota archaeon]
MKAAVISLGSVSSQWLAKALEKYFEKVDQIDIRRIEINLSPKKSDIIYKGNQLEHYDCIYAKGSFKYAAVLRALTRAFCKESYLPIKASAFTTGHDKLLTHLKMQQFRIPQPLTYLASTTKSAKNILKRIDYPIVMKLPSGTQGKGVMFADSYASASSMLDTLDTLKQPFIIQEYIETGGVDIRAIVVGEKVVASMKRMAVIGEKRANIHVGAKGEAYALDENTTKIAVDTAQAIGAEICAVDILESPKGPVVIEINLSPGLQGITEATKIDVADKIASFLAKKAAEMHEARKDIGSKKIMQEVVTDKKEIITNISMRGNRILLPELITKITKFTDEEELVMRAEKGKLSVEKLIGK